MTFLFDPHYQAMDANGDPLSGAKLYFFQTGTETAITTYQDSGLATPHASPVVADASGRFAPIYLNTSPFKFRLDTSADVVVQTVDPAYGGFDGFVTAGSDIASAATINLNTATGPFVDITGTVTVSTVTLSEGRVRKARATGAFQITASSTLIVNGSTSVNYTTVSGDLLLFQGDGSSVVRVWVIGRTLSGQLPAIGTAGQIPKVNSGATALEYVNQSLTLITSGSETSIASLDLTNVFTTAYSAYLLVLDDCLPATDSTQLYARLHDGTSFRSGASDYKYVGLNIGVGLGVSESPSDEADSEISITGNSQGFAAGGEELQGRIWIYNPKNTGRYCTMDWEVTYGDPSVTIRKVSGAGQLIAASASVQGIQLLYSSGNIASVRYWLYGLNAS